MDINSYIKQINEQYKTGNARENSYRPMLQQLLTDMLHDFIVTNEPARISCGAPDYIISRGNMPVFYIEAKDVNDNDLDGNNQHREQFERYKQSLDHIIFTDYLDFHLYENGEWIRNVRLAEIQGNNIRLLQQNVEDFNALVAHIADTHPAPITSATRLAQQMAAKARILAATINRAFKLAENNEEEAENNQQLQSQLEAFRHVLIHDLSSKDFADIYAQTIAYGMFAARLHDDTPDTFSRQEAANLIPKSNPFLRQIFQSIAGFDLDERIAWVVDDLVNIFLATDIKKVMRTYSHNNLHHDPMIHFYEDFLSAYNPKLRKSKGVWYTPQPVVQFIVQAVDEILQQDFNLTNGLADSSMIEHEVKNPAYEPSKPSRGNKNPKTITRSMHRVQILDPATGTGTFLAETINRIYDRFHDMQGMWQGYVTDHLIPRLHGFELLMASYAVAHLKLDMLLSETGFSQSNNQKRLKIYLTNSLEECHPDTGTLWAAWLSNEASEANHIKRDCPVMVMIGNPPYNGDSKNKGEWIMRLMESYKKEPGGEVQLNEKNPKWINDDYVKFIRLAQDYVERNGDGVIGYINPHGFLDNPTFRGMRWNLLKTFDKIYTINLHGNSKKKELCPDGSIDENVFDIMQGVSINLFVKTGKKAKNKLGRIFYYDLYGKREDKYTFLSNTKFSEVEYQELKPVEPMYFFVPKEFSLQEKYNSFISINKILILNSTGVLTANDRLNVSFSEQEQRTKIDEINTLSEDSWRMKYKRPKDTRDWTYIGAKEDTRSNGTMIKYAYRPFDLRYTYYTGNSKGLYTNPRKAVMNHFINRDNISLDVCKNSATNSWELAFISDKVVDDSFVSNRTKERGYVFPLYLYKEEFGTEQKIPNINAEEWQKFNNAVGRDTTPEELLDYIYAVLYSPMYRERYKEFLKVDFPRIPLPHSAEEFEYFAELGQQLIDLHLMKNANNWALETKFPESGSQKVEQASRKEDKIFINDTQYFSNVSDIAWNFYIGGYQPAQKWLKDRKGCILSYDDLMHYRQIIHALCETDKIMKDIDQKMTELLT